MTGFFFAWYNQVIAVNKHWLAKTLCAFKLLYRRKLFQRPFKQNSKEVFLSCDVLKNENATDCLTFIDALS